MLIQVKELPEADKEAQPIIDPAWLRFACLVMDGGGTSMDVLSSICLGIFMDYGISKSLITAIRVIRVKITHSIVVDYREIVYIDMGRKKEGLLPQTGWAAAI